MGKLLCNFEILAVYILNVCNSDYLSMKGCKLWYKWTCCAHDLTKLFTNQTNSQITMHILKLDVDFASIFPQSIKTAILRNMRFCVSWSIWLCGFILMVAVDHQTKRWHSLLHMCNSWSLWEWPESQHHSFRKFLFYRQLSFQFQNRGC